MLHSFMPTFFLFFLYLLSSDRGKLSSLCGFWDRFIWYHKIYSCVMWLDADTRGHPPVRVFWECQNSAQWQLFTLWQIHTNLHGGVSNKIFSDFIKLRTLSSYLSERAKWCEAFCVSVLQADEYLIYEKRVRVIGAHYTCMTCYLTLTCLSVYMSFKRGVISGAITSQYLLEKSRIVFQVKLNTQTHAHTNNKIGQVVSSEPPRS